MFKLLWTCFLCRKLRLEIPTPKLSLLNVLSRCRNWIIQEILAILVCQADIAKVFCFGIYLIFTLEKNKTQLYYIHVFFWNWEISPTLCFVMLCVYRMEFSRKNITHKDPLAKGQSAFKKQNLLHHLDEFMVFIMFACFFQKQIWKNESIWVEFPAAKSINTSSLSWPWLTWGRGGFKREFTAPLDLQTFLRWKIFESLWPYGPLPNRVGRKEWKNYSK